MSKVNTHAFLRAVDTELEQVVLALMVGGGSGGWRAECGRHHVDVAQGAGVHAEQVRRQDGVPGAAPGRRQWRRRLLALRGRLWSELQTISRNVPAGLSNENERDQHSQQAAVACAF